MSKVSYFVSNPVYRGKDFRQFYIFKSAGDAHDSVNLSKYSQERDTILLLTSYLCVYDR